MPPPFRTDDDERICADGDGLWIPRELGQHLRVLVIGEGKLAGALEPPGPCPAPERHEPPLGVSIDPHVSLLAAQLMGRTDDHERMRELRYSGLTASRSTFAKSAKHRMRNEAAGSSPT